MSGRPREFDRDEVLDKAMRLFWEQGYDATGIAQLGEHLGIGRQSLYATFGDKQTLFREALQRYGDQIIADVVSKLDAAGSGLENIHKVLDMWESNAARKNFCGCLVTNSISELGVREPELATILKHKLDRLEAAFSRALKRARENGEISSGVDTRAMARMLVNTGQGLAVAGKVADGAYARDVMKATRRLLK